MERKQSKTIISYAQLLLDTTILSYHIISSRWRVFQAEKLFSYFYTYFYLFSFHHIHNHQQDRPDAMIIIILLYNYTM